MAKKNWFIEANKSEDPKIKELLESYNQIDMSADGAEEKKETLATEIKVALGLIDKSDEEPENTNNDIPENVGNEKPENTGDTDKSDEEPENTSSEIPSQPMGFEYTEDDAKKAKDIETLDKIQDAVRVEKNRLEKTRLAHASYHENLELNKKIWAIERIGHAARMRKAALKEREHRARKLKAPNQLAIKRARFVKLIRQGISITNITKHPQGVKKEDLIDVLDSATIEACRKNISRFPEMWDGWKAKFIDNTDEKK